MGIDEWGEPVGVVVAPVFNAAAKGAPEIPVCRSEQSSQDAPATRWKDDPRRQPDAARIPVISTDRMHCLNSVSRRDVPIWTHRFPKSRRLVLVALC